MLRPERMARAVLAGPRDRLPQAIDVLHGMRLLHIVDHHGQDEAFGIGKPLPQASELSDNLVKLRSITNILKVETPAKGKEAVRLSDIRQKIVGLELNITEEDAARKKAESLLGDLDRRIEELTPFAGIGLSLETYRGYESLAVLVGRVPKALPDLTGEIPRAEVFQGPGVAAVFVPKTGAEQALAALGRLGFSQVEVPPGEGRPKALLEAAVADREKWRGRLEEIQGRLEKLREKYAGFVVAAQESLEVEVEKAEAPLRFAVSEHSFVIDGWVPASKSKELGPRLTGIGVHVEIGEPHGDHGAEPPVLLKNPKPTKPFEMLIHLYSTPSYHELDPTLFMLVSFPFFFGFMIGDAGYGMVFLAIGAAAFAKLPKESDFRRLLLIIALGGFWALLLGLFVFGEAFGMTFHHPAGAPAEELSWDQFGVYFPIEEPLLHKTLDIADMFYLSIAFAFVHLSISYVMGFVNEIRHSKRHAAAKLGWFLCLFGIFTLLTRTLSWSELAGWVWEVPLAWFPRGLGPLGPLSEALGIGIPFASLILILCAVLGFAESPVALLEIGGLLANVLSYLRLAGIGIGKATIAATFNTLILHSLILDKDIPLAIVGFVLLVFAQLLVFVLGGVSAGIQAVRLNYVESFTKFFKGNGTMFHPFGTRRPQEV